MKELIKATAKKIPDGFQVEASSRNFKVIIDEPEEMGGTNVGMNPVEMLLCALGSCQTIAAYIFAKANKINLNGFRVDLEGDLDPDGFTGKNPDVRNGFQEIRFSMHLNTDANQEDAEKFARFIEAHCPVGETLQNGVNLILTDVVIDK